MTFFDQLIALNQLDRFGFKRWLFYPGMLFGSRRTWWGAGRPRPFTHEGVDLCFFEAADGRRYRLDPAVRVPASENGTVVAMVDDFIGKTIVCTHTGNWGAGVPVYILYAHVVPSEALTPGAAFQKGEPLAQIAPADPGKTPLPPHLHLSVIRKDALPHPLPPSFGWPYINRLDRDAFYDPLSLAGPTKGSVRIIDFDPAMDERSEYALRAGQIGGGGTQTP
ncbi:MAG: hypothetical protein R6T92_13995 [Desulfosalsimonadaceae bacterium]